MSGFAADDDFVLMVGSKVSEIVDPYGLFDEIKYMLNGTRGFTGNNATVNTDLETAYGHLEDAVTALTACHEAIAQIRTDN